MSEFEDGKTYGQQIRRDAILEAMRKQITVWETEREKAERKAKRQPQYTSWRSRIEQINIYIAATKYWIDKIGRK